MSNNFDIPQPLAGGATDHPLPNQWSEIPPPPAGFVPLSSTQAASATSPMSSVMPSSISSVPKPPAGFVPEAQASQADTQSQPVDPRAKVGQVASDVLQGIGEGALDTVHGTGELIRKGLNLVPFTDHLGNRVIPEQGQGALAKIATTDNTTQGVGKTMESVAEFMLTSELGSSAWKVLTNGQRLQKMASTVKFLESHPVAFRAMRDAMIQAGQTFVKTGGDVKQSAEAGATMGGFAGATGLAGKAVGNVASRLTESGYEGASIERIKHLFTQYLRPSEEVAQDIKQSLDKAEDAMHSSFDSAITSVKDKIGDKIVKVGETPLFTAANEIKNANSTLPDALREGLKAVTPQSSNLDKLVSSITDTPDAGMSADSLMELRQALNKRIRNADPVIKQDIGSLLRGLDDTLDNLEGGVSKEYSNARTTYKETVRALDETFIDNIRQGKISDISDAIFKGQAAPYRIATLRKLVGDDAMQRLVLSKFAQTVESALDDAGHIDLKKFVRDWESIDPSARRSIFNQTPEAQIVGHSIEALVDAAKSAMRTASRIKISARVGSGLLGVTGLSTLLSGEPDKGNGNKLAGSLELAASMLGFSLGGRSANIAEKAFQDPKVLQWLGKLSGYNADAYVNLTKDAESKAFRRGMLNKLGEAVRSGTISHIFNPERGAVEPVNPNQSDRESHE